MNHAQLNKDDDDLMMVSVSELFSRVALELKESHEPETKLTTKIDETPKLFIYPNQIAILFRNLIPNAIKFKKDNNIEVLVSLEHDLYTEENTHYHRIRIKDDGIGFDTKFSKKIFDLFNELSLSPNSSKKSIGLNTCRKIMENHHGFITANSDSSNGAIFTCTFPVEG